MYNNYNKKEHYSILRIATQHNHVSIMISDSSILDRLSYSIPFTLCEAQFSCSHDYNSRDCTIELTEDQTSDTILPSATEAVCIPPFTVYSFLITVDVSDSLDIQVAGNINSTQGNNYDSLFTAKAEVCTCISY